MRDYIGERADWIADLIRVAQAAGEIDEGLSPNALAHFCMLLAMGSSLMTADMHSVSREDWSELLGRIAGGLAPAGRPAQPAQSPQPAQRAQPAQTGASR
jgi:hypothetical protein